MEQQLTAGQKLALLKEKHGTLKDVQKATMSTSWFIYNSEGDILYKGIDKPDMRSYKGCKAVEIPKEEYSFIDEKKKAVAEFLIEEDDDEVIRIIPRPIEKPTLKSDRDFLYEIPESFDTDYDVSITASNKWTVEVAEPSKIKTNIYFYVTAPQDPHVLIEKVVAKASDLQTGVATIERKTSVNEFSIYTHKLLDKYVRS